MVRTHPLRKWRKDNGKTLAELAGLVPEPHRPSTSHLSEIETGRNKPSLDLAVWLWEATGHQVPIHAFVGEAA